MVLTHAPKSRRTDGNSSLQPIHWTNRFRKASASRLNRKTSFLTLASCAFLLPTTLSLRSEADQPGSVAGSPAQSRSAFKSPAAPTESSLNATPVISPAPTAPLSSQSLLQLPSLPEATRAPLAESAPSGLQPASPKMVSDAAANVAASPASSLSPVTQIAPLPVESRPAQPQELKMARPTLRIRAIVSGKERQAQIAVTPKLTVGQALAAMGISLAALDRVVPDASALARDGMTVRLTRIRAQLHKRSTPIPATLRYKPTTVIAPGAKQTVQEAKPGALEITERIWSRDGKITKREFVSQRIAAFPQPQIVALGVKSHLMPGAVKPHRRYASALPFRGGTPRDRMLPPADPRTFAPINTFAPVKSFSVMTTGYSAGPSGGAVGNWTATGVRCTYGAVAVDPRLIPLGSKLYIEGYGYGFACDTGGAIKGSHIDLAFDSARAAFAHGKKRAKVWILGP